jgi:Coenzyme PQQ synthesis protein D (PqqD)
MHGDYHPVGRLDVEAHLLPDGTCLLFDPLTGAGRVLNAAGALTWDFCDGNLTADEIAHEIAALLPTIPDASVRAIELLETFAQQGLLASVIVEAPHPAR